MLRKVSISSVLVALSLSAFAAEKAARPVDSGDTGSSVRTSDRAIVKSVTNTQVPNSVASNVAPDNSSGEDSTAEDELLATANKNRIAAGVPELRMDASLRAAARAHAQLMVERGEFEHQLSGEASLMVRISQAGSLKLDRAGENIAYAASAPRANETLMQSPPHRQNLLDQGFNVAGVAAIWSEGRLYVVQDFAHELPSYSAQQTGELVSMAIDEMRQQAGLPVLARVAPTQLDDAACSLAHESRPNARLLPAAYQNQRVITYRQSRPEVLPQGALRMLGDANTRQFAVGSCYARTETYPAGMYWVAILLY